MKFNNNNRDFESMQAEGYFNSNYQSGDMPMNDFNSGYQNMGDMGISSSCCSFGMNSGFMGCPMQNEMMGDVLPGVVCPPVYECPRETVVNRYINHCVPHIIPCNTRIINHHIYRHTYTPAYSCCEENEVQNVYERRCC